MPSNVNPPTQTLEQTMPERTNHRTQNAPARSPSPVSRRDFLTLLWKSLLGISGLFGLGGVVKFFSYQTDPPPPTVFDLGLADDFPVGSRATIPEAEAFLMRTETGFRALSLICPHLGCVVDPNDQGFACPCHGSRFGVDGALQHGPADRPLRQLSIEITDDGHLILNTAG